MSALRKAHYQADDPTGHRHIDIPLVTALNQAGVVAYKYTPGFPFKVVRIRTYNLLKAGVVTGNVKVGTRTSCAVTFTSATENAGTLSGTAANLIGSKTEALSLEYTTDGAGVLTNGIVMVTIRPYPMRGEVQAGDP